MKIGFVGLGKLGFPVALACALKGHDVMGCDLNEVPNPWPHDEAGLDGKGQINDYNLSLVQVRDIRTVCDHAEILFLAIQTPHDPECEGITPNPPLKDFDYSYLYKAWAEVQTIITRPTRVAVISTVLPGTMATLPQENPYVRFAYNPFFIAMGTVMRDFLNPEFILNGGVDLSDFYSTITDAPVLKMEVESAELTKVAYNTFIGLKICFANLLGEICMKTGADVDAVTGALSQATDRLISPKYMTAGMGDGGGCHPRDGIALAWLSQKLDLHHNLFQDVMDCRQDHAQSLAITMEDYDLPKMILGTAFKPETRITTGSHALLVGEFLENPLLVDNYTVNKAYVILIGCKRPEYAGIQFVRGSVVIDPFRYIPDQDGVDVIHIG
jgi:UDPglucose 6-dehydrogenase